MKLFEVIYHLGRALVLSRTAHRELKMALELAIELTARFYEGTGQDL